MSGHQIDPNKYSAQNEKFTDKARGMFEKWTGKKVRYALMSHGWRLCV